MKIMQLKRIQLKEKHIKILRQYDEYVANGYTSNSFIARLIGITGKNLSNLLFSRDVLEAKSCEKVFFNIEIGAYWKDEDELISSFTPKYAARKLRKKERSMYEHIKVENYPIDLPWQSDTLTKKQSFHELLKTSDELNQNIVRVFQAKSPPGTDGLALPNHEPI